jgi:amidase
MASIMSEFPFGSATALAADIRAKRIGCAELLERYSARAARFDPPINAIILKDMERARARARDADAALARGEIWGPLHGVPMTVKESFDLEGTPTTWGVPELRGNIARSNAVAVDRLLAAGAVIFGKTNVPTLLAQWQTSNPIYGTTNNPWDVSLSPGGSSGGSAAALAAGLTALEMGSDIGGSIRDPAHYCGVYGHKPTYGIVPMRGQLFPGNVAPVDFFVAGPLARGARDLGVALNILAGPDALEVPGWQLRLREPTKRRLGEFRVALMLDDPNSEVDRGVQDRLQALADFLARQGATVSDTARPDIDLTKAYEIFITLLRAATSRTSASEIFRQQLAAVPSLAPEDRSYYARMIRANTIRHRDWLDVDEARHRMRWQWSAFFKEYDFLLCPAAASAACPHDYVGERYLRTIAVNGKQVPTTDQMFWAGISGLVNLPAMVAPIGPTPAGLPVGVQIIGAEYDDLACIGFAELLEREYHAFVPPPGYED